ncbi:hypothetical protein J3E68DRAFT_398688 [Trichoderma sp. SZMC 28012]
MQPSIPVGTVQPTHIVKNKTCDICHARFARSEHLQRHRRTHTNERPFRCPCCDQAFRRADVRKLHLEACHADDERSHGDLKAYGSTRRKKVRVACDSCRKRKTRCSGSQPCPSCKAIGMSCTYEQPRHEEPPAPPTPKSASVDGQSSHSPSSAEAATAFQADADRLSARIQHSNQSFQWSSINPSQHLGLPLAPAAQPLHDSVAEPQRESIGLGFQPIEATPLDPDPMVMWLGDSAFAPDSYSHYFPLNSISEAFMDHSDTYNFTRDPLLDILAPVPPGVQATSNFGSPSHHELPFDHQPLFSMIRKYFNRRYSASDLNEMDEAFGQVWTSELPSLAIYDTQVLDVFIGLALKHLLATFDLFHEVSLDKNTDASYILALAAVGGLFSSVEGSFKLAMAIYNHSRKLVLKRFNCSMKDDELSTDPAEWLVVTKTLMLLELYGYCSGDRRSHELAEAYHGQLLEAVQHYAMFRKSAPAQIDYQLFKTLAVLDLYRVLLLRRPPSLSLRYVDMLCPKPAALQDQRESLAAGWPEVLSSMLTPGCSIPSASSKSDLLGGLAALSPYVWLVIFESTSPATPGSAMRRPRDFLKRDYVTCASDKWLEAEIRLDPVAPCNLILYHCMNLVIHADLELLHRFFLHSPGNSTSSSSNLLRDFSKVLCNVQDWVASSDSSIASWHAASVMTLVRWTYGQGADHLDSISIDRNIPHSYLSSQDAQRIKLACQQAMVEPPHIAYAVFFATLVLWCRDTLQPEGGSRKAALLLLQGSQFLLAFRISVAHRLYQILNYRTK